MMKLVHSSLLVAGFLVPVSACNAAQTFEPAPTCDDGSVYEWGETVTWSSENGPDAREHPIFLADAPRNRLILVSGTGYDPQLRATLDAWAFDLETLRWSPLELRGDLPGGGSQRATELDENGVAYIYGGYDPQQVPQGGLYRLTVHDDRVDVVALEQVGEAPVAMLHSFFGPDAEGHFHLFGGLTVNASGFALSEGLWRLEIDGDRGRWSMVELRSEPSPRYGFAHGYDRGNGALLLWGGADLGFPVRQPTDTWRIDLRSGSSHPVSIGSGSPPTSRRNPLSAWNPVSGHLLIWGGASDPGTASSDNVALALDGSSARSIPLPDGPALRASGAAVHVPGSAMTWFGFGNSRTTRFQDLTPLIHCEVGR